MPPTSPDNQPAFELPKPVVNEASAAAPVPEVAPLPAEQQGKQAELPGSSLPVVPTQPAPVADPVPTTAIPTPAAPINNPVAPAGTNPAIADDVDLIEKEWVDKAKAIVERTREDPHQQNKQLNEFKADYMKKRYGREVRLTDE